MMAVKTPAPNLRAVSARAPSPKQQCKLSSGEMVERGWQGKDALSEYNWCNVCSCGGGKLVCIETGCTRNPKQSTEPSPPSIVRVTRTRTAAPAAPAALSAAPAALAAPAAPAALPAAPAAPAAPTESVPSEDDPTFYVKFDTTKVRRAGRTHMRIQADGTAQKKEKFYLSSFLSFIFSG